MLSLNALTERESRHRISTNTVNVPWQRHACVLILAGLTSAGGGRGSEPCDGGKVLAGAARAARQTRAFSGAAAYHVQVPGAPPHDERVEFGWGGDSEAFLRLPGVYSFAVRGGRLFAWADEGDAIVDVALEGTLQATLDRIFDQGGAPLVPPPLALRDESGGLALTEVFRSRVLEPLTVTGCAVAAGPRHEVAMAASNGSLRVRVDDAGAVESMEGEVQTAPEQPPIRVTASFTGAGVPPPAPPWPELERRRRVARISELSAAARFAKGQRAEGLALQALDGSNLAIESLRGTVVVLDFWATWCAPCRETLPATAAVAAWAEREKLPVQVLLVNTQEGLASLAEAGRLTAYLRDAGIALPTLIDLDGSVHRSFGGGLPLTVVLDRQGRVAEVFGGFDRELESRLREAVATLAR
jgi:thiol-disulfide isomerase/thioredoxin